MNFGSFPDESDKTPMVSSLFSLYVHNSSLIVEDFHFHESWQFIYLLLVHLLRNRYIDWICEFNGITIEFQRKYLSQGPIKYYDRGFESLTGNGCLCLSVINFWWSGTPFTESYNFE
jgi:hypothetical protein